MNALVYVMLITPIPLYLEQWDLKNVQTPLPILCTSKSQLRHILEKKIYSVVYLDAILGAHLLSMCDRVVEIISERRKSPSVTGTSSSGVNLATA